MPISNDVLIGQTLTHTVGHMVRINSTLLNFAQFHQKQLPSLMQGPLAFITILNLILKNQNGDIFWRFRTNKIELFLILAPNVQGTQNYFFMTILQSSL